MLMLVIPPPAPPLPKHTHALQSQLKAKGQLPAAPAAEDEAAADKKEDPDFKPFAGKGYSLRG